MRSASSTDAATIGLKTNIVLIASGSRPCSTASARTRSRYARTASTSRFDSASWICEFSPAKRMPRGEPPGEAMTGSEGSGSAFSGPSNE